jgi:hypothetical protein
MEGTQARPVKASDMAQTSCLHGPGHAGNPFGSALTGNDEDDASVEIKMLKRQTEHIRSFHDDGVYDRFGFREVLG